MGLYITVPGANFAGAAGQLGTQAFPPRDAMPYFGIPQLVNWWAAEDASTVGGMTTIVDRINGITAQAPAIGVSPAITTDGGLAALNFNTGPYMTLPASAELAAASWTWVIVVKPTALPAASPYQMSLIGGGGSSTAHRSWIMNTGAVKGQNGVPNVTSTAAKLSAGARCIVGISWNGTQMGFSFNGHFDQYIAMATAPVVESTVSIGSNNGAGGQPLNGLIYDVMQFNGDMHAPANATQWNYIVGQLDTYYGLS